MKNNEKALVIFSNPLTHYALSTVCVLNCGESVRHDGS
ncbi:MAG: hypothetical protein ACI90V_013390 [Bacillariaceae sp.]|jgi:hypothetical protein